MGNRAAARTRTLGSSVRGGGHTQELEDRAKFLDALVEKYAVQRPSEPPLVVLPPLPEDEAIRCIQVNERGRQGRERARIMGEIRRQQAFEEKVARMGGRAALTPDEAATRVQVRGVCGVATM